MLTITFNFCNIAKTSKMSVTVRKDKACEHIDVAAC